MTRSTRHAGLTVGVVMLLITSGLTAGPGASLGVFPTTIALDSAYAFAYLRLAEARVLLGQQMGLPPQAAHRSAEREVGV